MFKKISGTKDILPDESSSWQELENISRRIFALYNYKEVRLPLIEEAALFNRSLGESTEIVQKQMFLIKKEDDLYALRPEGTASVVRAYIENNLDKTAGFVKFYYIGPMFRMERPQKGRLRQFHHIGVEVIGASDAGIDVEVVSLADSLLKAYGISGHKIKLNSLGCPKDKLNFAESLRTKLNDKLDKLCPDCNNRFKQNVLRILDCKQDSCRSIVQGLNIQNEHLCQDCRGHFEKVTAGLHSLGVSFEVDTHLVRGLDYYTRTVFEISHPNLGAQDAIGAGGRYDNLVKNLDGPDSPAVGFAFGVERLLLVLAGAVCQKSQGLTYIITLGSKAQDKGVRLLNDLRQQGIVADTDYEGKSLKAAMRIANDLKARFVVIIGDNELDKNTVLVKDMVSGEQKELPESQLLKEIKC